MLRYALIAFGGVVAAGTIFVQLVDSPRFREDSRTPSVYLVGILSCTLVIGTCLRHPLGWASGIGVGLIGAYELVRRRRQFRGLPVGTLLLSALVLGLQIALGIALCTRAGRTAFGF